MIISGIYRIVLVADERCYVGQTINVAIRWKHHRQSLKHGRHSSTYLQNAWNKYGPDAFAFEVLEECLPDPELLTEREQFWMDHYQPVFNPTLVAGRANWVGRRHTAETRAKMSAAAKGKQSWWTGRTHSEETRTLLREQRLGRPFSPERLAALKAAGELRRGRPLTAAHRAAISAATKGRPKTPETRERMAAAQRAKLVGPAAENATKTHCKHGHEFTPENTYVYKGHRICRACGRENMRKYRAASAAA